MTYVVGGFDGHGSTLSVARAREKNVSFSNLIIKYPDTSPENMPKLLYSMNMTGEDVEIVDIGINVKNPSEWQRIMDIVAENNQIIIYDHHETNLKLLQYLPKNIKLVQFSNTIEMLDALIQDEGNRQIGLIGSFTDRDPEIKKILSPESREFVEYYQIANAYDVAIRNNLSQTIKNVYEQGFSYLQKLPSLVEYPPEQLSKQIQVRKIDNIIIADAMSVDLKVWTWKVLDYLMYTNGVDYGIMTASVLDRQLNQKIPVLFVARYWLADVPNPMPILKNVLAKRRMIGHEEAFSISLASEREADQLINEIVNALQSQYSSSSLLLNSLSVAKSVQSDFNKILNKLTEILDEQRKMYQDYLELKRQQVELLKNTSNENARRYD